MRGAAEDYPDRHPATAELVVEICVTSHDHDRSKLRAYATAGVKEVWLVLAPEKQVEVHRRPEAGRFTDFAVLGTGATLTSPAMPALTLPLAELFRA